MTNTNDTTTTTSTSTTNVLRHAVLVPGFKLPLIVGKWVGEEMFSLYVLPDGRLEGYVEKDVEKVEWYDSSYNEREAASNRQIKKKVRVKREASPEELRKIAEIIGVPVKVVTEPPPTQAPPTQAPAPKGGTSSRRRSEGREPPPPNNPFAGLKGMLK